MRPRFFILLCACGLAPGLVPPVLAQVGEETPPRYRFEDYRTSEGLAVDAWVEHILQDQRGFLWVGTAFGLHRYDGYTFENVYYAFAIDGLIEDHEGMIWVAKQEMGLSRFDPEAGTFTDYQHDPDDPTSLSDNVIRALHIDQHGTLWVGTLAGLDRFEPDTGTFTKFQHAPDNPGSLSVGAAVRIYEDREGFLWVGTTTNEPRVRNVIGTGIGSGLNRFDRTTQTFTSFHHEPGNVYSLIDNQISHINEDREGNLYVGTCESGLHRYDRERDRFERLRPPTDPAIRPNQDTDHVYAPPGIALEDSCNPVTIIHEDTEGGFWVGTFGGGLNHFHEGTLTHYGSDPADPYSLSTDAVVSMYEDRQGTRWIGTHLGGLNKVVPNPARGFRPLVVDTARPERAPVVTAIMEDAAGRLWMGTNQGEIYRLDPSTGTRLDPPFRLTAGHIEGLYEDREGVIWAGNIGLFALDPEAGVRKSYRAQTPGRRPHQSDTRAPDESGRLGNVYVNNILEDTTGQLWVGTWGGVYRLDRATGTFTHYAHDPQDPGSLAGNSIFPLYVDRQGTFWVGVYQDKGLSRYDPATDQFINFLDSTAVNALYEDTKGRFWVGSWGSGLLHFDRATGAHTTYSTADGLVHDIVGSILEDDQGFLWIVTVGGLSRFDPETEIFVNFTEEDGFPNTMTDAEQDEALKSQSGDLIIAGERGVTIVSPGAFATNPHPPAVIVRGLRVFDAPLQEAGMLPPSVELAHDQNDLTFEYVGLHFTRPEKNRYAYRLEGYEEGWREVGNQRTARYTSLDPGDYTFCVKAASSDGVWNDEGASVRVTILPPWWRTVWAYLLYGLLLIGGIFAVDRTQRRRLLARERERTRERERAQAKAIEKAYHELRETKDRLVQQEKMASLGQLTAGIAHEIKNPLNFINNFAEVNEELADELRETLANGESVDDLLKDLKQNTQVIAQHGKRADGIVHAMMQHASGGTGRREVTDICQIVSEHIDLAYHVKRAQVPELHVEIERNLDGDMDKVEIVPQEIGRVLLNLLGNAFDAVHEHAAKVKGEYIPTVTVSTRQADGQIEIRVKDNGPGIPAEIRAKIFEPFFTTKSTGTGLGLSLSYDIVTQGHGGTLTVESQEGQGATFIVTLPTNQTEADSSS